VKYSRGANDDDVAAGHVVEGEGNFRYVTLVTFKGGGNIIEAYRKNARHKPLYGEPEPPKAAEPDHAASAAPGPSTAPAPADSAAPPATGPTPVVAIRDRPFHTHADARSALTEIYGINGFSRGLTEVDHADMRVLVASVVDKVAPTTELGSRVPDKWADFTLDELNEYLRVPVFLEDWFDCRPLKTLPDPVIEDLNEQVATIEEKAPPQASSSDKPPEKASRMLLHTLGKEVARLAITPDIVAEHVRDATAGRTADLHALTMHEGRELLAYLRTLGPVPA
jgi:hypothetical protein